MREWHYIGVFKHRFWSSVKEERHSDKDRDRNVWGRYCGWSLWYMKGRQQEGDRCSIRTGESFAPTPSFHR